MKRKFTNLMLSAVLMAGMTLNLASCKDDDEPSNTTDDNGENTEETNTEDPFWGVLGQIVAADEITDDYAGKTFTVCYGSEDPSDPQTRIVETNTLEAAAERFAALTGADIDENTSSYTATIDNVGTLTYNKATDGTAWATVDVQIAAVPTLTKIIYRSAEQGNTNASFPGSAYYRFGDVISRVRTEDGVTEYWICVRPAFSPEGKGDCHWVSVSPLPKNNIYEYPASNGKTYRLPKDLKYNTEHFQNLAEMLFAMTDPGLWDENITNYSPKIFHDFHKDNVKYHNKAYWTNVGKAWNDKGLYEKIFGKNGDAIKDLLQGDGISFLYRSYSWSTTFSNSPMLYQVKYTNTPRTKYCNMQTKSPSCNQKTQVIYKNDPTKDIELDITQANPSYTNSKFFGDANPRWIIRYATSAELSDTKTYNSIYGPISGAEEIYRYYRDVEPVASLADHKPETTYINPTATSYYHVGDIIMRNSDGTPWICVRPAAGKNIDNNSYWICLSPFDQNDNCIIPSTTKQYTMDLTENKKTVSKKVTFTYAKGLMSKHTAQAASHTFNMLTDSRINIENAAAVLAGLKDAGFDITPLNKLVGSADANKGYAGYGFAYGDPIEPTTMQSMTLQPFLMGSMDQNESNKTITEEIVTILQIENDNFATLSLTDGFDKKYIKDILDAPFETWNCAYDFRHKLHRLDKLAGKVEFIYSEATANIQSEDQIAYAYMTANAIQIIISPELTIEDNSSDRPSGASQFTDVYVSAKKLNGKYVDYWNSLSKYTINISDKKIASYDYYTEF